MHERRRQERPAAGEEPGEGRIRRPGSARPAGRGDRVLRKKLEAEGYKVSDYREGDWKALLLYARHRESGFFVDVGAEGPPHDQLILSVVTPCYMPPGKHQEQISAPAPRLPQVAPVPAAATDSPWSADPFG
ncbi:hypothetical protein [Streptomyces sp. NPDC050738]|uniref:hypothetical protein n=1 Tax=Streptomyces sp. NPDC050738 TaxID=3154744 RepID=UPI00341A1E30